MVSLPIKWVRKYGMKKGEQLDVLEAGRKLIVSAEGDVEKTKTEINLISDDYIYIWRVLSAAYISGYDEIRVNFNKLEILEWVQRLVTETLIGFEIVEQKADYCVIRNISGNKMDEFDSILRRIFLVLVQASEVFMDYLEKGGDPSLILNLEKTNNRQTYLLKRLVTKEGIGSGNKSNFMSTMIFLLEGILNDFKFAVWYIQGEKKIKVTKRTVEHYRRLHEEIEDVYKLYYNYDDELVRKILVKGLKTDSKTGANLVLFEDNPRLAHSIINITEKIRYIANQIIGINS
jgi:hypothetical protein